MIGSSGVYSTNENPVSGGTVSLSQQLNLGNSVNVISLGSSVVTAPGTYTIFQTGTGVVWDGSTLSADYDLIGKVDFQVPSGYAVQKAFVDSTGLNVKVTVRRALI